MIEWVEKSLEVNQLAVNKGKAEESRSDVQSAPENLNDEKMKRMFSSKQKTLQTDDDFWFLKLFYTEILAVLIFKNNVKKIWLHRKFEK